MRAAGTHRGLWKRPIPLAGGALVLGLLASCGVLPSSEPFGDTAPAARLTPAPPQPNPLTSPAPTQRPRPIAPAPDSAFLAARYERIERDLIARGRLRTDAGRDEPPVAAETLARNFLRIALFDEFVPAGGALLARETESALRRWEDPVRIGLVHGVSVDSRQRQEDEAFVSALAARVAIITGHDIATGPAAAANLTVFVVDEAERRALGPTLRRLVPGLSFDLVRAVTDMPPTTFCLIVAFSEDSAPHVYRRAFAVVRAEHPPLLRRSCFHEEIAQGLGLANDSPAARPSIFNDDEEFALLTVQDEQMLAILYDDRLRPGMTAAEAAPVVEIIARELADPNRRQAGTAADPATAPAPALSGEG